MLYINVIIVIPPAPRDMLLLCIYIANINEKTSCLVTTFLHSDVDQVLFQNMWKDDEGNLCCKLCDYRSRNSNHVKNHIESKHLEGYFKCEMCQKVCPTRNALNMHIHRKHKS